MSSSALGDPASLLLMLLLQTDGCVVVLAVRAVGGASEAEGCHGLADGGRDGDGILPLGEAARQHSTVGNGFRVGCGSKTGKIRITSTTVYGMPLPCNDYYNSQYKTISHI